MPKQVRRHRLQVPFDKEVLDALSDFADATGKTRARICEEIVAESIPSMYQMINALDQLEVDKSGGFRSIAELMYRAAEEAKQMGLELDAEIKQMPK